MTPDDFKQPLYLVVRGTGLQQEITERVQIEYGQETVALRRIRPGVAGCITLYDRAVGGDMLMDWLFERTQTEETNDIVTVTIPTWVSQHHR